MERGRVSIGSLRSLVSPLITESLLRFQQKYPAVDVVIHEGRQSQIAAMLRERDIELGILCWPNLDPIITDLVPLLVLRERVPMMTTPEIAAELRPEPKMEDVLRACRGSSRSTGGRSIRMRRWRCSAAPLFRWNCPPARPAASPSAAKASASSSTRPSPTTSPPAASPKSPLDVDAVHRDIAMVVRNSSVLDRDMLKDFAVEIAEECRKSGTIIETVLGTEGARTRLSWPHGACRGRRPRRLYCRHARTRANCSSAFYDMLMESQYWSPSQHARLISAASSSSCCGMRTRYRAVL